MKRRRTQTAERAAGFAATWARLWAPRDSTALMRVEKRDRELIAAVKEANELYPAAPPISLALARNGRPLFALIVTALVLAAFPLAFMTWGGSRSAVRADRDAGSCLLDDGRVLAGRCPIGPASGRHGTWRP
jgi:hypothetical protein